MAESKKTEGAASKGAASPADVTKVVNVKNTSGGIVNTCKGTIKAGKTGKATIAELRAYSGYLEEA